MRGRQTNRERQGEDIGNTYKSTDWSLGWGPPLTSAQCVGGLWLCQARPAFVIHQDFFGKNSTQGAPNMLGLWVPLLPFNSFQREPVACNSGIIGGSM